MPKVFRVRSPSIDRSRSSPYSSNSKNVELHKAMNLSGSDEDVKEWEEARCPICMESPHNAVLLRCSSHQMGCRPFMCNTSYRHSNCLDQFCKSFAPHLSTAILQEIPLTSTASRRSWEVQSDPGNPSQCGSQLERKMCPLCRGEIYGYMVLEPARRYMNSKVRSCSSETCEFQGTYSELRNHARSEHPSVRPSEVDPSRQRDWMRMEQERDLEDFLSTIQVSSGEEFDRDSIFAGGLISFMSLLFVGIFHSIDEANRMSRVLDGSRQRVPLHDRRSGTVLRASDDARTNRSARWRRNSSSMHAMEAYHTGRWRTNSSPVNDVEPNFTARWRTGMPSSRSRRDLNQYYREASPGVGSSSMRTPRASQQPTRATPWRNISSGRNPRGQRLRWRDHRWSPRNNLQ